MKNTVQYSDTRSDRLESLLTAGLAVAGLLVVVIGLVYFGHFLDELRRSLWRLRGGAPVFVALAQQQPNEPFRPQIPKTWDDEQYEPVHNQIRALRAREHGMWLISSDVTGERDGRISYGLLL